MIKRAMDLLGSFTGKRLGLAVGLTGITAYVFGEIDVQAMWAMVGLAAVFTAGVVLTDIFVEEDDD